MPTTVQEASARRGTHVPAGKLRLARATAPALSMGRPVSRSAAEAARRVVEAHPRAEAELAALMERWLRSVA